MITHSAIASLYTVPLSALNGLVWVVWAREQARPIRFENFRIGQSLSNRIESDWGFEFESNLEASQVPIVVVVVLALSSSMFMVRWSETCEAGRYFVREHSQCVECPHGTYQPRSGQDFCVQCPAETTTDHQAAVSDTQCKSKLHIAQSWFITRAYHSLADLQSLFRPLHCKFSEIKLTHCRGGTWTVEEVPLECYRPILLGQIVFYPFSSLLYQL